MHADSLARSRPPETRNTTPVLGLPSEKGQNEIQRRSLTNFNFPTKNKHAHIPEDFWALKFARDGIFIDDTYRFFRGIARKLLLWDRDEYSCDRRRCSIAEVERRTILTERKPRRREVQAVSQAGVEKTAESSYLVRYNSPSDHLILIHVSPFDACLLGSDIRYYYSGSAVVVAVVSSLSVRCLRHSHSHLMVDTHVFLVPCKELLYQQQYKSKYCIWYLV